MIAIPCALTLIRLLLGPAAIALAWWKVDRHFFLPILQAGLLTDFFDGVAARWLGVSRPWLRRFDSATDVFFYLCILAATAITSPATVAHAAVPLSLLLVSEVACAGVSLAKFSVLPATHCYSAKVYGVALFTTFAAVLSFGMGPDAFWALTFLGLAANVEVLTILFLSAKSPVDVGSLWHLLRQKQKRERKMVA
jgi:phosphatidylglycerophosphate synthase